MKRRRYLAGLAIATGLAGCSDSAYRDQDGEGTPQSTPSETSQSTGTDADDTDEADDSTATDTPESSPTETSGDSQGDFQPKITFDNCARVIIEAPAYDTVALDFGDKTQQFDKGYEGRHDFRGKADYTGRIIEKVSVTYQGDTAQRTNPDRNSC